MLMDADKSSLLVVDIQEKLLPAMADPSSVVVNTSKLADAANILNIPIIVSEQYPKGLGSTSGAVRSDLERATIFEKIHFSCYQDSAIRAHFAESKTRQQIIIVGLEAHVCVLQTAIEFSKHGYDVFVVEDACSSRKQSSANVAFDRMRQSGVIIVTLEMVLFEWLGQAGTTKFREISAMIK